MNPDSLSSYRYGNPYSSYETGDVVEGHRPNKANQFSKDIIESLEQGDVDQALSLIAKERIAQEVPSFSLTEVFKNLLAAYLQIFKQQPAKPVEGPTFVKFVFQLVKGAASLLAIKLPKFLVLKLPKFLLQSLPYIPKGILHLKEAMKHKFQQIANVLAPFFTPFVQLYHKISSYWNMAKEKVEKLQNKVEAFVEKMQKAFHRRIDPVVNRVKEKIQKIEKKLLKILEEVEKVYGQAASKILAKSHDLMIFAQPYINLFAGFVTQRKVTVERSVQSLLNQFRKAGQWLQKKSLKVLHRSVQMCTVPMKYVSSIFGVLLSLLGKFLLRIGKKVLRFFKTFFYISYSIVVQLGKALWFLFSGLGFLVFRRIRRLFPKKIAHDYTTRNDTF